jgi:hypothetical protein
MVSLWMAAGLLRAQSGFRRVRGCQRLGELAIALRGAHAATPASAPEKVAEAPFSGAPSGVAAE